jgi:DNA-binding MarR family transcriptional regulator
MRRRPTLAFDPIAEAARQWEANWGPESVEPMRALTSIMRVQQVLLARCNAIVAPHELTFARYEALMLLFYSRRGALPLGKLGTRLQVHPTAVTKLVDGLERSGYAVRSPHPTDRRTTLATITREGRTAARRATLALNEQRFGTSPLADGELTAMADVLRRVRQDEGDFGEAQA